MEVKVKTRKDRQDRFNFILSQCLLSGFQYMTLVVLLGELAVSLQLLVGLHLYVGSKIVPGKRRRPGLAEKCIVGRTTRRAYAASTPVVVTMVD